MMRQFFGREREFLWYINIFIFKHVDDKKNENSKSVCLFFLSQFIFL